MEVDKCPVDYLEWGRMAVVSEVVSELVLEVVLEVEVVVDSHQNGTPHHFSDRYRQISDSIHVPAANSMSTLCIQASVGKPGNIDHEC